MTEQHFLDIENIKKRYSFSVFTLHINEESPSTNLLSRCEEDFLKIYSPLTKKVVENYIFYYYKESAVNFIEIKKCDDTCACKKVYSEQL